MNRATIYGTSLLFLFGILVTGCGTTTKAAKHNNSSAKSTSNNASSGKTTGSSKKVSAVNIKPVVDASASPKAGQIVFAVDDTMPPMEFVNKSNRLIGFDIDFGDELGKMLHEKVVWKPVQWDGIVAGLTSGDFNAILSTMNVTPKRQKVIQFAKYGDFGQIVVVRSNSKIKGVSSLKGKTVGVQIGTTSAKAARGISGVKIKTYNTSPDAFQDLAAGRINAVIVAEVTGRYYMTKKHGMFKVAGKPFQVEPVGIGLRKNETPLKKKLDKAIAKMKSDGMYQKIYSYWFGTNTQYK